MADHPDKVALETDAPAVFKRLVEKLTIMPAETDAPLWKDAPSEDGTFSDLVYPGPGAVEDVEPLQIHLDRVQQLASFALSSPDRAAYHQYAAKALGYYIDRDYKTKNWWQRDIGLAKRAASGLLLLSEIGLNDDLAKMAKYLKGLSNINPGSRHKTGANMADYAYIQLLWALAGWKAKNDQAYLEDAYAASQAVSKLCMPVTLDGPEKGEGIRADWSFSQHNPEIEGKLYSQLYAGTYGVELVNNIFNFKAVLSGCYSLSRDAITSLEKFIVNGMGWFAAEGAYDFHVCGRAITRGLASNENWTQWCDALLADKPDNKVALEELKGRVVSESVRNHYLGTRAYWLNDYMCALSKHFSFFLKVVSSRTVGTESGNGENLMGYHLGWGSYTFLPEGIEHSDHVHDTWDWQKIPGTTVERCEPFNPKQQDWGKGAQGSHDFAGVFSDGINGIASMQFSRDNILDARKTVVRLPYGVTCLGSNITLSSNTYTTVEQCKRNGPVFEFYSDGTYREIPDTYEENKQTAKIAGIFHNGIIYYFHLAEQEIEITTQPNLSICLNHEKNSNYMYSTVSLEELHDTLAPHAIWLDGYFNPFKIASWETNPELYIKTFLALTPHPDRFYIIKTPKTQSHTHIAYWPNHTAGSCFRAHEIITLRACLFSASAPCAFIAHDNHAYIDIRIYDPTQKLEKIELTIYSAYGDESNHLINLAFETGEPSPHVTRITLIPDRQSPTGVRAEVHHH